MESELKENVEVISTQYIDPVTTEYKISFNNRHCKRIHKV